MLQCCNVCYATCNDSYAKPADAAIGGMNCTIIALFGVNLATAEAPPPLVITPNIPEPDNPANIIVSVIAVPPS